MKRSQPSLRPRRRYLVAEVVSPVPIAAEALGQALRREVRDLFGDSGAAAVDARVEVSAPISAGDPRSRALLRVVRERADEARAALTVLREIEGRPVAVRVVGISGTVRGARRWMPREAGFAPPPPRRLVPRRAGLAALPQAATPANAVRGRAGNEEVKRGSVN